MLLLKLQSLYPIYACAAADRPTVSTADLLPLPHTEHASLTGRSANQTTKVILSLDPLLLLLRR